MPDFIRYELPTSTFQPSTLARTNIDRLINREFGLNTKSPSAVADISGNLVTTMQAGAVAGALVCSPFADRYGRKPSLLIVAIASLIGALMQTVSYGYFAVFYIGR